MCVHPFQNRARLIAASGSFSSAHTVSKLGSNTGASCSDSKLAHGSVAGSQTISLNCEDKEFSVVWAHRSLCEPRADGYIQANEKVTPKSVLFRKAPLFSKVTPKSCLRGFPACHLNHLLTPSLLLSFPPSLLPSFSPSLLLSFPPSSVFLLLPPCGHQWARAISQAIRSVCNLPGWGSLDVR